MLSFLFYNEEATLVCEVVHLLVLAEQVQELDGLAALLLFSRRGLRVRG